MTTKHKPEQQLGNQRADDVRRRFGGGWNSIGKDFQEGAIARDWYYAVIEWSAPFVPRFTARRMFDNEPMGGIGWIVVSEHETLKDARAAARQSRAAYRNR